MKLIALVGFQDSGKDTTAKYLVGSRGFKHHSFAESLKDALASIFVWDRKLLEGDTPEGRAWRETVDDWWAKKLDIPNFTPRYAMQYVGTEVMRVQFNKDIWIYNIERKLSRYTGNDRVVLIDGRFPNELQLARRYGGKVIRIRRGADPDWYQTARKANFGDQTSLDTMVKSGIHSSEWAWIGHPIDIVIDNNGTLDDLQRKITKHLG